MVARPGIAGFAWLALAALLVIASATLLGPSWIDPRHIAHDPTAATIFWKLRVARTLLAAAAGAALATGGVVFQSIFRNPLAEPYTLGVASGASLGAACGFYFGIRGDAAAYIPLLGRWPGIRGEVETGIPASTLLACLGALGAITLVYLVSRLRPDRSLGRLLIAGVCVAYICSSGVLLVTYLADRAITNEIVVWMMGSLSIHRPRAALEIAIVLVPVAAFLLARRRALDLLHFGEHLAMTRGVNVGATVWSALAAVGLLTAVTVACCGPIGFVGLLVPHVARGIFGLHTGPLLVGSALVGGAFLAACDGVARVMPVSELPVGVVTNMLGAAFLLYLLATRETLMR